MVFHLAPPLVHIRREGEEVAEDHAKTDKLSSPQETLPWIKEYSESKPQSIALFRARQLIKINRYETLYLSFVYKNVHLNKKARPNGCHLHTRQVIALMNHDPPPPGPVQ